ncbi:MAG: amidohydrolase family protein [Candidatus Aminicenantes bacterium]|nr:amidohydrolase family protein [Candidatus Aminicenantes bacterium]
MNLKHIRTNLALLLLITGGLCALSACNSQSPSGNYDIIIQNATIIDGTGAQGYEGDVAIKGKHIAALGKVNGESPILIDGTGLIVCPGFIDPHSHADMTIMQFPLAENLVAQGITSFLGGNCGLSPAPRKDTSFGEWLSRAEEAGIAINYMPLVGHHPVRQMVMGNDFKRTARDDEIVQMQAYVEEAMQSGSFGFSTFLDPSPSEFADTDELIELVKIAGKHGGIFVPHTRGTQLQWPTDNVEEFGYTIIHRPLEHALIGRYLGYVEAVEVSRRAKTPLHIAHMGNGYWIPQPHPAFLKEAVAKATYSEIVDKAREEGLEVTFDLMPFEATIMGETSVASEFSNPRLPWVQEFGLKKLIKKNLIDNLKDKEFREAVKEVHERGRMKLSMLNTKVDPYWYTRFQIITSENEAYTGKFLDEIVRMKETSPLDTVFDLIVEDPDITWVQAIDPRLNAQAIEEGLKHPQGMPCTDTSASSFKMPAQMTPPPIAYGLYPNYIKTYVKEKGILTLEDAIRKATTVPAAFLGIDDRGILREGACADILLFDFNTINYPGDFRNPAQKPEGIKAVIVNGTIVYKDREFTGEKPGEVIRHR